MNGQHNRVSRLRSLSSEATTELWSPTGPVLGVEERRDPDPAPRGRGAPPRQPQAEDRLDGPGGARRASPDPAQSVASAPDRHPGHAAALAPAHGHQEVDPAQGPGTPATG